MSTKECTEVEMNIINNLDGNWQLVRRANSEADSWEWAVDALLQAEDCMKMND